MSHEFLRMQKLSGVITESEYNQKIEELNSTESSTETLNENVVGVGGTMNPYPAKKKEVYESAFSKFLGEEKDMENMEEGGDYYEGPTHEGEEKDDADKKALDKKEDELDEKDMETETLKEKIKHHADAIKNIKKELEDLTKDLGEDEEDEEKEKKEEVDEALDMAEEALKKNRDEEMEEAMSNPDQRHKDDKGSDRGAERKSLDSEPRYNKKDTK